MPVETMLVSEAAEAMGVSEQHVRRLANAGVIRIRDRVGTIMRLDAADVRREARMRAEQRRAVADIEKM